MPSRLAFFVAVLLLALITTGCAGRNKQSQQATAASVVPQQIQTATMAFANRYIASTVDCYDDIIRHTDSPEVQLNAIRGKLVGATSVISAAVQTNPVVGLMDQAVFVTLNRSIAQRPATAQLFGQQHTDKLIAALKKQETDVWSIAAGYLTPDQIAELHKLCEQWLEEHPTQRYAINVDLADFQQQQKKDASGKQLVSSVFGLITLDPFTGLDPAVREVEQTRIMAERMFFYLRHAPMLLTWQVDSLYLQLLEAPQSKQLLADTARITASTTQFSDATSRFSDATSRVADTVEHFRKQLPEQQATLVEQLNQTIGVQRDAALKQATTQLSSQQDALTKHLNTLSADSIDRLYARARSLILITVGSILCAVVLYRRVLRPKS